MAALSGRKYLIVNADDFGISPGVNRGVIETHERGIVTSASVMTRWRAAREAADFAKAHPRLGVGLHVDLGEWVCRDDQWTPIYEVVPMNDDAAVRDEIRRQLDAFRQLLGRDPDHIDSHQHVHRDGAARAIVAEIGGELQVPVRHFTPAVRYCGDFYGQDRNGEPIPASISAEALIDIIGHLSAPATELCCHPGFVDFETMYTQERQRELETLCHPRVRQALNEAGVELCSFADLRS